MGDGKMTEDISYSEDFIGRTRVRAYPDCPECEGINYPTFDHESGKFYLKCHSCGYDSRKEE